MVGGEGTSAAVEELVKGTRQAAEFAEQFRAYSESEKHWKARMEFILRHLPNYQDQPEGGRRLDQLLALSMVWANHLFLGCRSKKWTRGPIHYALEANKQIVPVLFKSILL
ncbi:CDKN2AIP N-terminal-like protein isoform 4-T4 [Sarcophilus harrisii]